MVPERGDYGKAEANGQGHPQDQIYKKDNKKSNA